MLYREQRIALVIPCFNEEATIGQVVRTFRQVLPELRVYVFDNLSTDRTTEVAGAAGAEVVSVSLRGKGNVVRRMFADVESDVYLMVDGDATYDAASARRMVDKLLNDRLDMVVGARCTDATTSGVVYRTGHKLGNRLLTRCVAGIFGGTFTDMLSGYRAFSRRFAKTFPAFSNGFEVETELTVHALELRMPYAEIFTAYYSRPIGSQSKLSTYRDGYRILRTIARLYISERPLTFFCMCAVLLSTISILLSIPLLSEFLKTGLVPRLPTAVLSASLMISALLSAFCGLILRVVTKGRREAKLLAYLRICSSDVAPAPAQPADSCSDESSYSRTAGTSTAAGCIKHDIATHAHQ